MATFLCSKCNSKIQFVVDYKKHMKICPGENRLRITRSLSILGSPSTNVDQLNNELDNDKSEKMQRRSMSRITDNICPDTAKLKLRSINNINYKGGLGLLATKRNVKNQVDKTNHVCLNGFQDFKPQDKMVKQKTNLNDCKRNNISDEFKRITRLHKSLNDNWGVDNKGAFIDDICEKSETIKNNQGEVRKVISKPSFQNFSTNEKKPMRDSLKVDKLNTDNILMSLDISDTGMKTRQQIAINKYKIISRIPKYRSKSLVDSYFISKISGNATEDNVGKLSEICNEDLNKCRKALRLSHEKVESENKVFESEFVDSMHSKKGPDRQFLRKEIKTIVDEPIRTKGLFSLNVNTLNNIERMTSSESRMNVPFVDNTDENNAKKILEGCKTRRQLSLQIVPAGSREIKNNGKTISQNITKNGIIAQNHNRKRRRQSDENIGATIDQQCKTRRQQSLSVVSTRNINSLETLNRLKLGKPNNITDFDSEDDVILQRYEMRQRQSLDGGISKTIKKSSTKPPVKYGKENIDIQGMVIACKSESLVLKVKDELKEVSLDIVTPRVKDINKMNSNSNAIDKATYITRRHHSLYNTQIHDNFQMNIETGRRVLKDVRKSKGYIKEDRDNCDLQTENTETIMDYPQTAIKSNNEADRFIEIPSLVSCRIEGENRLNRETNDNDGVSLKINPAIKVAQNVNDNKSDGYLSPSSINELTGMGMTHKTMNCHRRNMPTIEEKIDSTTNIEKGNDVQSEGIEESLGQINVDSDDGMLLSFIINTEKNGTECHNDNHSVSPKIVQEIEEVNDNLSETTDVSREQINHYNDSSQNNDSYRTVDRNVNCYSDAETEEMKYCGDNDTCLSPSIAKTTGQINANNGDGLSLHIVVEIEDINVADNVSEVTDIQEEDQPVDEGINDIFDHGISIIEEIDASASDIVLQSLTSRVGEMNVINSTSEITENQEKSSCNVLEEHHIIDVEETDVSERSIVKCNITPRIEEIVNIQVEDVDRNEYFSFTNEVRISSPVITRIEDADNLSSDTIVDNFREITQIDEKVLCTTEQRINDSIDSEVISLESITRMDETEASRNNNLTTNADARAQEVDIKRLSDDSDLDCSIDDDLSMSSFSDIENLDIKFRSDNVNSDNVSPPAVTEIEEIECKSKETDGDIIVKADSSTQITNTEQDSVSESKIDGDIYQCIDEELLSILISAIEDRKTDSTNKCVELDKSESENETRTAETILIDLDKKEEHTIVPVFPDVIPEVEEEDELLWLLDPSIIEQCETNVTKEDEKIKLNEVELSKEHSKFVEDNLLLSKNEHRKIDVTLDKVVNCSLQSSEIGIGEAPLVLEAKKDDLISQTVEYNVSNIVVKDIDTTLQSNEHSDAFCEVEEDNKKVIDSSDDYKNNVTSKQGLPSDIIKKDEHIIINLMDENLDIPNLMTSNSKGITPKVLQSLSRDSDEQIQSKITNDSNEHVTYTKVYMKQRNAHEHPVKRKSAVIRTDETDKPVKLSNMSFQCKICPQIFDSLCQLQTHTLLHSLEMSLKSTSLSEYRNSKAVSIEKPLKPPSVTPRTGTALKRAKPHNDTKVSKHEPAAKKYKCDKCFVNFTNCHAYSSHFRAHHNAKLTESKSRKTKNDAKVDTEIDSQDTKNKAEDRADECEVDALNSENKGGIVNKDSSVGQAGPGNSESEPGKGPLTSRVGPMDGEVATMSHASSRAAYIQEIQAKLIREYFPGLLGCGTCGLMFKTTASLNSHKDTVHVKRASTR